jgi:uncharacterized membrane protein
LFQSSLSSSLSTNVIHSGESTDITYRRLGQHFTPNLLLWIPLYALFPNPATLIFLQVTLFTLAGFILYRLALCYLLADLASRITISYYVSIAILGSAIGNFFDNCQIPLFTFALFLAKEKQKWGFFWLFALLVLGIREDAGVVLVGIGIYWLISKSSPKIGLGLSVLSLGYMLLLTNLVMPIFSDDISKRFMMEKFGQFTESDQANTLQIIWAILQNPWRLMVVFLTPFSSKVGYLIDHWLPLAFMPFFSFPSWVMTALPLTQIFLQDGDVRLSPYVRYALPVIPGLFYGMIIWWSNHLDWLTTNLKKFWQVCLVASLISILVNNPHQALFFVIPDSIQPWVYISLPTQWQHVNKINSVLSQIPEEETVSASRFLVPRLSCRRVILRFPYLVFTSGGINEQEVNYVVADLWHSEQRYLLKKERSNLKDTIEDVEVLLANPNYGLVDFQQGVVLLKRGTSNNTSAFHDWLEYRQQF